jgi:8-oxo-dGTP pyrophosphatase MutT (NUDIX family)
MATQFRKRKKEAIVQSTAEKVTAFVTRSSPRGVELLLFEHPSGGIQLPAGTVEAGEAHDAAAAREAWEETGLPDLPPGRFLAALNETLPEDHFIVVATTRVYARPDHTSFDWASIRNGIMVRRHRIQGDFSHVTYVEFDERADPPYVSFQITGWMPTAALTRRVTRYFYHFAYQGQTPQNWQVATDNQRFRLFWALLAQLPPLVTPQQWWLTVLTQAEI